MLRYEDVQNRFFYLEPLVLRNLSKSSSMVDSAVKFKFEINPKCLNSLSCSISFPIVNLKSSTFYSNQMCFFRLTLPFLYKAETSKIVVRRCFWKFVGKLVNHWVRPRRYCSGAGTKPRLYCSAACTNKLLQWWDLVINCINKRSMTS